MALVAVLVADLFEDVEFWYPYYRLLEAGHDAVVVGCDAGVTYRGKRGTSTESTVAAEALDAGDLDAVVVPGGYSPDHMRRCPSMVDLVRKVGAADKPVAAICHGPWMLASAGLLPGRTVTSFFSIEDDLVNAGATWVDEETVRDGNLITARAPGDLPAFMPVVLTALEGGAA
jgi:protease I